MKSLASRPWLTPTALLVVAMVFLLITQVTLPQTLLLSLIVSSQALTGAFIWRLAQRHRAVGIIEATGVGLAIGTAATLIFGAALRPISTWSWLLPALIALMIWIVRRARGLRLPKCGAPNRAGVVALVVGGMLGALSLAANVANYPLSWEGMWGEVPPRHALLRSNLPGHRPLRSRRQHPDGRREHSLSLADLRLGWTDQRLG